MNKVTVEGRNPDASSDKNENYNRKDQRTIEVSRVSSSDKEVEIQLYDEDGLPIANGKIRVFAPGLIKLMEALVFILLLVFIGSFFY